MRKPVQVKVKEYVSNPFEEYKRLNTFLNQECYFRDTIYDFLETYYDKCQSLYFVHYTLNECINAYCKIIPQYLNNEKFNYDDLEEGIKQEILYDFLNYCEILYCVIDAIENDADFNYYGRVGLNREIISDFKSIIKVSLSSVGYKLEVTSDPIERIKIFKNNSEIEFVTNYTNDRINYAIKGYLGIRNEEIQEKEEKLLALITYLLPSINKYKIIEEKQNLVWKELGKDHLVESLFNKISGYVQLVKHTDEREEKKNQQAKQYKWYYEEKNKYLDDVFNLCICVQSYNIYKEKNEKAKNIVSKFDKLKKNN